MTAARPQTAPPVAGATYLDRPLAPGAPITLWRHSAVTEEPFDLPASPMAGEMDPFFFRTRERNFIPHEYPCRTEFARRYRDRHSGIRATGPAEIVSLGFGSPRLDLSGFWVRPTRIAARAETLIFADRPGRARLRLVTCGGAVLELGGRAVLTMAPYRRNFETEAEVSVDLPGGETRIALHLDDLAERDTRFLAELVYLDGPPARQAIAAPAAATGIEAALQGMRFARPAHDGGPVTVLLPAPLTRPLRATARISGDFLSRDAPPPITADLPAGADRFELGRAEDLPAGFAQVEVTLAADGFAASRALGTEIAHPAPPAPATSAARVEEALATVAERGEAGTVRALARLARGDGGPRTREMIAAALPGIDACWDCADFDLVPLIVARTRFGDLLGALADRIDATILGFRYWMDEPGNDVQWYFSENHALLFHTAAHLGGALLPDRTFRRSGRTGAEQSAVGGERLRAWFDHFERWEMAEFNAAPYFPIDLKGLTALQALSPDPALRERAAAAIARLMELVANAAHRGHLTAAQGRSYEHSLRATLTSELSAIGRMLWGTGRVGGARLHALPGLALCLRDHGLVLPDLADRADWRGAGAQEWTFAQGEGRFARLYHHKSADHAMGSAVGYRWDEWGYQETLLHLRMGDDPDAQVWINHPGELVHSGFGRPSYWGGSASIPRVQQYRDLAVVRFAGQPPQPDLTHAWFPRAAFDATRIDGATAWAQAGGAHLLLRGSRPFEPVETGPTAGCELRLPGRDGRWLLRLGSRALHGDAAAFAARFAALDVTEAAGTLTIDDPDYGPVRFRPDGTVEAEGRRIDPGVFTVVGERVILGAGSFGA
ncbi:hypothetical protein, partial [uncultured Jannaschia sp.]|uniref:hypothetical protein n=1 Tax=uncultured Jannaschia sp. TaxID=293347 RepID=UPI002608CB06